MRYALKFAYDGTEYAGYARQPNQKTVEETVIDSMVSLGVINDSAENDFQSASRTDRGVSSGGNVIAVTTDFKKEAILSALNSRLESIHFYGIAEVSESFNARHARQRWYRYIASKNHCPSMAGISDIVFLFLGEHDFRLFSKRDSGKENTILKIDSIDIIRDGSYIFIDIKAERFLWQMVRRVVSAMISIANDELEPEVVENMLKGSSMKLANPPPAPPEPLILMDVSYGFSFEHQRGQADIFQEEYHIARLRAESMSQIMKRITSA